MDAYERERSIKQVIDQFHVWRDGVIEQLPALLGRINALHGKPYPGYGFHYALVKDFYHMANLVVNYPPLYADGNWASIPVICEVLLDSLVEQVDKAEQYIQEHNL